MTIYDIIAERAQQIIMAADYTSTPPQSPNLSIIRERYPLKLSVNEIDALIWREAENIADDVIFNDFR